MTARWEAGEGVRRGVQAAVSSCRLLSAPSSAGCVAPVSSAPQYGIIQYLQPGIITGLQSARAVSLRMLALLITCHMFGFGPTLVFKGRRRRGAGDGRKQSAQPRCVIKDKIQASGAENALCAKAAAVQKEGFHNLDAAGAHEQPGSIS